jgi:hypothetical protein
MKSALDHMHLSALDDRKDYENQGIENVFIVNAALHKAGLSDVTVSMGEHGNITVRLNKKYKLGDVI